MGTMAPQITSLTIVYSTVYSGTDQSKHQSSTSLAFVWGIHRGPVNSPHKWPVTWKMFPFDDVIMIYVNGALAKLLLEWGIDVLSHHIPLFDMIQLFIHDYIQFWIISSFFIFVIIILNVITYPCSGDMGPKLWYGHYQKKPNGVWKRVMHDISGAFLFFTTQSDN